MKGKRPETRDKRKVAQRLPFLETLRFFCEIPTQSRRLRKARSLRYPFPSRCDRRSSLAAGSRGQAQVEFVLSILFVMLLIFGMFEVIMLLYTYNVLADAAKEGVRYAIVRGADSTAPCPGCTPSVTSVVTSWAKASFHDISGMTVTVSYPDGGGSNAPPNRVQVQVSYPYKPFLNLGWPAVKINAAAEGRIFY